jgi:hypothetical protein
MDTIYDMIAEFGTVGYTDRFETVQALIVPSDMVRKYRQNGYVKAQPVKSSKKSYKKDNEYRRDGIQFLKIDFEGILSLNPRYFYDGIKSDVRLHASDLYGFLYIEEFKENYFIEVRSADDIEEKFDMSRDIVKKLRDQGYEAKIMGDKILIYVRKKIKN